MIKKLEPLTLAEVEELANGEKQQELRNFIKKFTKINSEKAKKMREELLKLNLLKLKEEHITKIVDFMPEDVVDLLKIMPDISLDQNEINKILEIVKKY